MNNSEQPAFPVETTLNEGKVLGKQTGIITGFSIGLTKLEYASIMAIGDIS